MDFAKEWNIKRIAYAASFGTEEWEYTEEQTRNCSTLLKKFNAVSVRESSAVKLCNEKFKVEALHVLDPTMLLEKDEYINLDGTTAGWELIGTTAIDLSGYVTTSDLNTALADYTTTANLTTLLNANQPEPPKY